MHPVGEVGLEGPGLQRGITRDWVKKFGGLIGHGLSLQCVVVQFVVLPYVLLLMFPIVLQFVTDGRFMLLMICCCCA